MDQTRELLLQFSGISQYALFFFVTTGCCVGLPFNSDLLFIVGAYLASIGHFHFWPLLTLAFFGLILGDSINFFIARRYGKAILRLRPFCYILSENKVTEAESFLNTRGTRFLFFVRFLPLIRTVLYFTAGSLQVRPRTFYAWNVSSTLLYLPVLMGSAYYASDNLAQVYGTLKKFQFALLAMVIVIGLVFLLKKKPMKVSAS